MAAAARLAGMVIAATAVLAAGCASQGSTAARAGAAHMARVPLASVDDGAAAFNVRYDAPTGQCSAGALQLLQRDAMRQLTAGWDEDGEECDPPRKHGVPESADYPATLQTRGIRGGAQVLVLIDRDGRVQQAQAVCASDALFATAAEAAAREIAFTPAMCGGEPRRWSGLLPFDYDI